MTDWEDFQEAVRGEAALGATAKSLTEIHQELGSIARAIARTKEDIGEDGAGLGSRRPSQPGSAREAELAVWRLERYQARKKIRAVEALHRPKGLRDLAGMLRRLLRELRTPSDLPPMPEDNTTAEQADLETRARELLKSGREEAALRLLDQFEGDEPSSALLELRRDANIRLGGLTQAHSAILRLQEVNPSGALAKQGRTMLSRIIETDPTWLPSLPRTDRLPEPLPGVVLHLVKESVPYFHRGYTIRSQRSFEAQIAAGLKPEVITHLGFPRVQGIEEFPLTQNVDGVTYHRLDLGPDYPYRNMPHDLLLDDHATTALQVALQVRPSFVQAGSGYRGYETALVGLALARRLEIPFVYEIRSFFESTWTGDASRADSGEYYERRWGQELRCLLEADHVITISDTMLDELVGRGVPADKITVVPNGVDPAVFLPQPKDPGLLGELGIGDSEVIGYISNLSWREGHDFLIEAGRILRDRGRDTKVLIVGEGPEMENLQTYAEEAGVADRVIFTGSVPHEEIVKYYALIDVFVVPRRSDRAANLVTPLKPLEAMAMGLPIVSSDLPALRELVEPGVRGELFQAEDPNALADAVDRLLDDPERRKQLGDTGRTWVAANRTWDHNVDRYRSVFAGLGSESS